MYPNKATLEIVGKLETMAEHWTQEELDNHRRIVMFRKTQSGSTVTATFKAVGIGQRPPNSICISCIVISVDAIYLIEQLVAAPSRFTVEEKSRIRRNLESFGPLTVSKTKPESEEFKVIMALPRPKPRTTERDVKAFPWKKFEPALKKIIGKYSASTIPQQLTNHPNSDKFGDRIPANGHQSHHPWYEASGEPHT
ncbi:MedA [Tolypocladium paradoxum]|uniref:MedA n=1 Tax=Tolypocladium paradoxum TaxID=94208 RepID=A0A2S4L8D7_9HYPO|nr:MedA [Tolypocladium paradoxum]